MICKKCGTKNSNNAGVCSKCGASLKEQRSSGGGAGISISTIGFALSCVAIAVLVTIMPMFNLHIYFFSRQEDESGESYEQTLQYGKEGLLQSSGDSITFTRSIEFVNETAEKQKAMATLSVYSGGSAVVASSSDENGEEDEELETIEVGNVGTAAHLNEDFKEYYSAVVSVFSSKIQVAATKDEMNSIVDDGKKTLDKVGDLADSKTEVFTEFKNYYNELNDKNKEEDEKHDKDDKDYNKFKSQRNKLLSSVKSSYTYLLSICTEEEELNNTLEESMAMLGKVGEVTDKNIDDINKESNELAKSIDNSISVKEYSLREVTAQSDRVGAANGLFKAFAILLLLSLIGAVISSFTNLYGLRLVTMIANLAIPFLMFLVVVIVWTVGNDVTAMNVFSGQMDIINNTSNALGIETGYVFVLLMSIVQFVFGIQFFNDN